MERPNLRLGESQMGFTIRLAQWSSMAIVRNHTLEEAATAVLKVECNGSVFEVTQTKIKVAAAIRALKTEV